MAVEGYCNPTKIAEYFEAARDTVNAEVIRINRDTPSFWADFMPKGAWQTGKGWTQQRKYYEQSYISAHSPWRNVAEEAVADTLDEVKPEVIKFGSSFTTFHMERHEARGPKVSLLSIPDKQSFGEELERQYGQLARVGRFKLENRYRDAHIMFSNRKYLAKADGAGGLPYYADAFPSAAAGGVALPHHSMLDFLAAHLDAEGGWQDNMGIADGAPYYFAVASNEAIDQILRSDSAARDDIRRSSLRDELLKRWHADLLYKRFAYIVDVQAPRFRFSGGAFHRVEYFREAVASIGQKSEPNPDWQTAPYEAIQVVANRLGPQALMMPKISEPGGNTDFDAAHNDFVFDFINYGDNSTNPTRNHGYFLGSCMEAIDPRQNRFVLNLMVARNVNYIVFTTPTAPAGSVPAIAGLNLFTDQDQCGLLPAEECSNFQEFICTPGTPDGFANQIVLSPIRDGAVALSDTVKIAGAGNVVFTVEEINSTGGLTDNEVALGYNGTPINCDQLVRDWKLTNATTGVDVEDDATS